MVLMEKFSDLVPGFVYRRRNDVAWRLACQLNDVLTKIRLRNLNTSLFKHLIQPDLLGDHGLTFDNETRIRLLTDSTDNRAGLRGGSRPMDVPTVLYRLPFVSFKVQIQMTEHMVFDIASCIAQRIELGQTRGSLAAGSGESAPCPAHSLSEHRVSQRLAGLAPKSGVHT